MTFDKQTERRVRAYLEENRSNVVRDLMRLIRVPSVRSDELPGAPYGSACLRGLNEAISLFRENGFEAKASEGNFYGLAAFGEGERSVALFGHTDVVPVGDDWDYTAPFDPAEIEGCVVGRGSVDNKAAIVISLWIMRAVRDLSLPIGGKLIAFIGAAEETGMEDVAAFVRENPMPDFSIIPDNSYPVSLGEKGICRFFARSRGSLTDVLSFEGGFAYNVVLDRVTIGLRADSPVARALPGAIGEDPAFTLSGNDDLLTLTATGVTAHAGTPEGSVNAALRACRLLLSIPVLNAGDRRIFSDAADLLSGVHGEPFGLSRTDPYFGPVTTANGIARVRDGKLGLSFDLRYGTSVPAALVEEKISENLARARFDLVSIDNDEGFRLSEDSPAAKAIVGVYRALSGDASALPYYSGGGTYARHLKNAFSVGTSLPGYPMPKMRSGHGEEHQPDEAINVDAMLGSAVMTLAMTAAVLDTL